MISAATVNHSVTFGEVFIRISSKRESASIVAKVIIILRVIYYGFVHGHLVSYWLWGFHR